MKKFIKLTIFFIKTSRKYISWNFKNGQIKRLLFHVIYYPIAYLRFMYFSYKHNKL